MIKYKNGPIEQALTPVVRKRKSLLVNDLREGKQAEIRNEIYGMYAESKFLLNIMFVIKKYALLVIKNKIIFPSFFLLLNNYKISSYIFHCFFRIGLAAHKDNMQFNYIFFLE